MTGPGQLAVRCAGKLGGRRSAGADGAVVLDKRFGLLGFGAEVSAELPLPSQVWRALDTEGDQRRPEEVESVGTRHRAAYRFVNDHPGALAIAISSIRL